MNKPAKGHILQPVLQWGTSDAGGWQRWSVTCWFLYGSGHAFYHDVVGVYPGDTLVGVMKLRQHRLTMPSATTAPSWASRKWYLTVQFISEQKVATETLECYRMEQCSDHPDTAPSAVTAINRRIRTAAASYHRLTGS